MMAENNLADSNSPYILTKDSNLFTVGQESPRTAELLSEYGLHCISCFFSEYDTLETGAQIHGMNKSEINDMILEINNQLEKEWKENHKSKNKLHK
jgi:hybrid cluster-associated redox disulfide protein